ncbi:MAG TPA: ATPase, T2SS/T4P/T4SS family [Armatimonadota bacterium]|nr:ATPase, T2SS/T4P/T4SS family [Armatimonadota bacterium]
MAHHTPVRPQDYDVAADAVQPLSREQAQQYGVCPLALTRDAAGGFTLALACAQPEQPALIEQLQRLTGYRVQLVPALAADVQRGIELHYSLHTLEAPVDLLAEAGAPGAPAGERPGARTTVEDLLQRAVNERATDIHLQPDEDTVYVRYRIDGVMSDFASYDPALHPQVISRIKILANLDIAQTRLPQDGRFEAKFGKRMYDVRVSVVPISHGEKIVLRLLPKGQLAFDLRRMGFSETHVRLLEELIGKPYGMILATGPTGAGKTTTLYALLAKIDCVGNNVITVEDPVEYQLPHVSQMQVHPKIGLTFAHGLRAILRQDPDIIMVGEIRDGETLEMAVQSALTGHLVLSTLHCNDAAAAAARMMDMGEEPFLIASSVSGFIAQRLVRRLCVKCRAPATVSDTVRHQLGIADETPLYVGAGCDTCRGTGYLGRISLFEVVPNLAPIQEAIVRKAAVGDIRALIRALNIPTLREDGLAKVIAGITSLEEYLRAVYET